MGDHPSWCTLCSFSHTPLNGIPIMLTLPLWDMVAVFSSLCIWCLWHLSNLSWSANVWLISHPCNKRLLMCSQGPHNAFRRNTASTLLVSLSTYKKVWFFFLLWCSYLYCYRTMKPYLHWMLWAQRVEDREKENYYSYYFPAPMGFFSSERLLHFLLPFPHMNVKMSKVNHKLIVS